MSAVPAPVPGSDDRRALSSLRFGRLTPGRLHRGGCVRGIGGELDPGVQVPPQGNRRTVARTGVGDDRSGSRRRAHVGSRSCRSGGSRAASPRPPEGTRIQSRHHTRARDLRTNQLSAGHRPAGSNPRYPDANPSGASAAARQRARRLSMHCAARADDLAGRRCRDYRKHPRRSGAFPASRGRKKDSGLVCGANSLGTGVLSARAIRRSPRAGDPDPGAS